MFKPIYWMFKNLNLHWNPMTFVMAFAATETSHLVVQPGSTPRAGHSTAWLNARAPDECPNKMNGVGKTLHLYMGSWEYHGNIQDIHQWANSDIWACLNMEECTARQLWPFWWGKWWLTSGFGETLCSNKARQTRIFCCDLLGVSNGIYPPWSMGIFLWKKLIFQHEILGTRSLKMWEFHRHWNWSWE